MGDSDDLVLLLLQGLLNFWKLWAGSDWSLELSDVCAVNAEAFGEGVTEVTSVQDEDIVSWLGEVGSDDIPAKGSRAGDNQWLRVWCGGLEKLAEHGKSLAEGLDECWGSVGLALTFVSK